MIAFSCEMIFALSFFMGGEHNSILLNMGYSDLFDG